MGWEGCGLPSSDFKWLGKAAVCLYLISNGLRGLRFALIPFQLGWEGYALPFFRSPYTSTAADGWAWHRAEIVRHLAIGQASIGLVGARTLLFSINLLSVVFTPTTQVIHDGGEVLGI